MDLNAAWLMSQWPALLVWMGLSWFMVWRFKHLGYRFLALFQLKILSGIVLTGAYLMYLAGDDLFLYYETTQYVIQQIHFDPSAGWKLWWYGFTETEDVVVFMYSNQLPWPQAHAFLINPKTMSLVRILTLLWYPAGGTLFGLSFYSSAFAFAGSWFLYAEIRKYNSEQSPSSLFFLFLLPCVLLWSSGLLKDSWVFGSQCMLLAGILAFLQNRRIYWLIFLALPAYLMLEIRPYLLFALLPFVLWWLGLELSKNKKVVQSIILVSFPLLGLAFTLLFPEILEYILTKAEDNRYYAYIYAREAGQIGSGFDIGQPEDTLPAEAYRWLKALWACLFRPQLWESFSLLSLPMVIESTITLFLTAYIIIYLDRQKIRDVWRQRPLWLVLLVFSITYGTFMGLSVSFFGSMWRYKIYVLPFFLMGLSGFVKKKHPLKAIHELIWP